MDSVGGYMYILPGAVEEAWAGGSLTMRASIRLLRTSMDFSIASIYAWLLFPSIEVKRDSCFKAISFFKSAICVAIVASILVGVDGC